MNANVTEFRAEVPQSSVDDLRTRLSLTRWPDAETVSDWSQGSPSTGSTSTTGVRSSHD
jgi:hypothetical protein